MRAERQIHGPYAATHVDREGGRDIARSRSTNLAPDPPSRFPDPQETQEGVREFAAVLWRRRAVVLLPIIITPILAFTYALLQNPVYSSSADVLVTSGGVSTDLQLPGISVEGQPSGMPERK